MKTSQTGISSIPTTKEQDTAVPISPIGNLRDAVLLNISIIFLFLVFKLFHLLNSRFRKAVDSFDAEYQFRAGRSARRLIFKDNRIKTRRGTGAAPDFEINFIDLPGALAYMAKYPNDLITLLMENKIEQTGNLYFLYRFGYFCGLCESIIRNLFRRRGAVEKNAPSNGKQ